MKKIAVCFIASFFMSGCLIVGPLQELSDVFASDRDKIVMFTDTVNAYRRAIHGRKIHNASAYVSDDALSDFMALHSNKRKKEKLVDYEIQDVQFADGNSEATVEVEVRYYKVPHFMIKTRVERERWEYHRLTGGWRLEAVNVPEEVLQADAEVDSV